MSTERGMVLLALVLGIFFPPGLFLLTTGLFIRVLIDQQSSLDTKVVWYFMVGLTLAASVAWAIVVTWVLGR